MNQCSDNKLVNNIKNGIFENESIKELERRHLPLASHVVSSNLYKNSNSIKNEIVSEFSSIIFNSAKRFNENKNTKFSTLLFNDVFFKCKHANINNMKQTVDIDIVSRYLCKEESDICDMFRAVEIAIDKIGDPIAKKIIQLRYFKPTNGKLTIWSEIGKEMNLSGQQCLNIHNSAIKKLRKKFSNG